MSFRLQGIERKRVQLDCCEDEVLTEQHHKDGCDINKIVGRYGLQHISNFAQQFGDALVQADPVDFHESMSIVAAGQSAFAALDPSIRKRFHNKPELFMDFIHDSRNIDEMYELGLITKKPQAESDLQSDSKPVGSGGELPPETSSDDVSPSPDG